MLRLTPHHDPASKQQLYSQPCYFTYVYSTVVVLSTVDRRVSRKRVSCSCESSHKPDSPPPRVRRGKERGAQRTYLLSSALVILDPFSWILWDRRILSFIRFFFRCYFFSVATVPLSPINQNIRTSSYFSLKPYLLTSAHQLQNRLHTQHPTQPGSKPVVGARATAVLRKVSSTAVLPRRVGLPSLVLGLGSANNCNLNEPIRSCPHFANSIYCHATLL